MPENSRIMSEIFYIRRIFRNNMVVKNGKGCDGCSEAPCEIWMKTRDPKFSDEEFDENVRGRVQALRETT